MTAPRVRDRDSTLTAPMMKIMSPRARSHVSVDVQRGLARISSSNGLRVRDAARTLAPSRSRPMRATRCVDLNHFAALSACRVPTQRRFCEGYLTCDMTALEPTRALRGAYCNIKGRVVADVMVVLSEAHPTLVMHASLRERGDRRACANTSRSRARDSSSVDAAPILLGLVNPTAQRLPDEAANGRTVSRRYAIAMPGSTSRRVMLLLPQTDAGKGGLARVCARRNRRRDASVWDLLDIRAGIAHVITATSGRLPAADARLRQVGRDQLYEGLLPRSGDRCPYATPRTREAPSPTTELEWRKSAAGRCGVGRRRQPPRRHVGRNRRRGTASAAKRWRFSTTTAPATLHADGATFVPQ